MPFMLPVPIVIAKHPAIVFMGEEVIDKGQIVASYFAACILPNFFTDKTRPTYAPDRRYFVDDLPQSSYRGHKNRLTQLGHRMPLLIMSEW